MATYVFDLPPGSLDPCPNACGGLTEDPYGGPCQRCWGAVEGSRCRDMWHRYDSRLVACPTCGGRDEVP